MTRIVVTKGLGAYTESSRLNERAVDHSEMCVDEIWETKLQRVAYPIDPTQDITDIQGGIMHLIFLLISLIRFIPNKLKSLIGALRQLIWPPEMYTSESPFMKEHRLQELKSKWNSVKTLPTYICQADVLPLMKEIGHRSDAEIETGRNPSDFPTKTYVMLELDPHGRPFVRFLIETIMSDWLVDTGASLSIMTKALFDSLPQKDSLPRIGSHPKVFDHQSNPIPIIASVLCRATFGDKTLLLPFLVSSTSSTNVLGMSALVGRSLMLSHRGHEAFLIIGECRATERPSLTMSKRSPLFVARDIIIPGEATRRIQVSPFVYPSSVTIEDHYVKVEYLTELDGLKGITTHAKLDENGLMGLRMHNDSLIERHLPQCSIIGTAEYDPNYIPPNTPKLKCPIAPLPKVDKTPLSGDDQIPQRKTSCAQNPSKPESESTQGDPHGPTHVPAKVHEIPTPDPPQPRGTSPCFCNIEQDTVIIRGNKYGDCCIPHLNYVGYNRSPLPSGQAFRFQRGRKTIIIIYGETEQDLRQALDLCPDNPKVAYIVNNDPTKELGDRRALKLSGDCQAHPFPYGLRPDYVSASLTDAKEASHSKMTHQLRNRVVLNIAQFYAELYWDQANLKQAHLIVHVPSILVMQKPLLHNFIAALFMPFISSMRILEPYVAPPSFKYQTFLTILSNLAKMYRLSIQVRSPNAEHMTYPACSDPIKSCTCDVCMKIRDQQTYTPYRNDV